MTNSRPFLLGHQDILILIRQDEKKSMNNHLRLIEASGTSSKTTWSILNTASGSGVWTRKDVRTGAKLSQWKAPYHNARACLECMARLTRLEQG